MAKERDLAYYVAIYDSVDSAKADLDAIEQLHKDDLIGTFDAAIVDKENGRTNPKRCGCGFSCLRFLHSLSRWSPWVGPAVAIVGFSMVDLREVLGARNSWVVSAGLRELPSFHSLGWNCLVRDYGYAAVCDC